MSGNRAIIWEARTFKEIVEMVRNVQIVSEGWRYIEPVSRYGTVYTLSNNRIIGCASIWTTNYEDGDKAEPPEWYELM